MNVVCFGAVPIWKCCGLALWDSGDKNIMDLDSSQLISSQGENTETTQIELIATWTM